MRIDRFYFLVFITFLFAVLINFPFSKIPPGSDMISHIGAINNILWGNKELSFYSYPLLMHFIMAAFVHFAKIQVYTTLKAFHVIIILVTIVGFYKLGKETLSKTSGVILAFLMALYPSQEFWLGLVYMAPSTIALAIFPYFVLGLYKESKIYLITSLLLSLLFYWFFFFPLFFLGYLYKMWLKKRYIFVFTPLLMLLLILTFFKDYTLSFFGIPLYSQLSENFYVYIIELFKSFFFAFFGITLFFFKKVKHVKIGIIALFSGVIWAILFFPVPLLGKRLAIFLILGLAIFSIIFLEYLTEKLRGPYPFVITVLFFVLITSMVVPVNNYLLSQSNVDENELEGLNWLHNYDPTPEYILSDPYTMNLAINFVANKENYEGETLYSIYNTNSTFQMQLMGFLKQGEYSNILEEYSIVYVIISSRTRDWTQKNLYKPSYFPPKLKNTSPLLIEKGVLLSNNFSLIYSKNELDIYGKT